MAISSWIETGIRLKMENEIMASADFRGYFEESFWTDNHAMGIEILTMKHVLPSLMALVFGLILSMIIFIVERLVLCLKKKKKKKVGVKTREHKIGTSPLAQGSIK